MVASIQKLVDAQKSKDLRAFNPGDNEMLRQEMAAMIQTVNKMADIVANIATVGHKLKQDWEQVRKNFHPTNEAGEDVPHDR